MKNLGWAGARCVAAGLADFLVVFFAAFTTGFFRAMAMALLVTLIQTGQT